MLQIKRVQSIDASPTKAAGWNSAYDSQVILSNSGINLGNGAYYTIDGRVGTPSGNNFGISVRCTSSCAAVSSPGTTSHVSLRYFELYGPACVETENCDGTTGAQGLNILNSADYLLVEYAYIHRWGESMRAANWSNVIIQYSTVADTHNDGLQHEDILYSYAQTNLTMRYNHFYTSLNDGIFFDYGGTNGFYFYGNTFFHSGGSLITFKEDTGGPQALNVYIHNNVFENDETFGDYMPGWLDVKGVDSTSGEVANNVFENIDIDGTAPNANHNAYNTAGGGGDGGTGSFTYTSGSQFVTESASNPLAADFHLTTGGRSAFGRGKILPAPYNIDTDGSMRGSTGAWTVGAFQ